MGIRETVATKLVGVSEELARRKALLDEVLAAFDSGGNEAVKSELLQKVEALEKDFEAVLGKLRAML